LLCQDSDWNNDPLLTYDDPTRGYASCNDGTLGDSARFQLSAASVGLARGLIALAEDTALLLTVPACPETGCTKAAMTGGGLWVARNEGGSDGLSYTPVAWPDTDPADGCSAAEFFEYGYEQQEGKPVLVNPRQSFTVHPSAYGAGDGDTVRVFLTSSPENCGLVELEFELGDEAGARRYNIDLAKDGPDAGLLPDCNLHGADEFVINGAHAARDGRWLFAYGGQTALGSTLDAICAIDLDSGGEGDYATYERVAANSTVEFSIMSLVSHPHVSDTAYFGGWGQPACDTCKPPGLFSLQRRRKWEPSVGDYRWQWGFVRLSDDDLQVRTVKDIDFGPGVGTRTSRITTIYVSGVSWWDGAVSW
jgi:hypothetical protein